MIRWLRVYPIHPGNSPTLNFAVSSNFLRLEFQLKMNAYFFLVTTIRPKLHGAPNDWFVLKSCAFSLSSYGLFSAESDTNTLSSDKAMIMPVSTYE